MLVNFLKLIVNSYFFILSGLVLVARVELEYAPVRRADPGQEREDPDLESVLEDPVPEIVARGQEAEIDHGPVKRIESARVDPAVTERLFLHRIPQN